MQRAGGEKNALGNCEAEPLPVSPSAIGEAEISIEFGANLLSALRPIAQRLSTGRDLWPGQVQFLVSLRPSVLNAMLACAQPWEGQRQWIEGLPLKLRDDLLGRIG